MTMTLLEVNNLTIGYQTPDGLTKAVDRVSFSVERGSSVGLVGESGCGKTTIGMALMGLLPSNARVVDGSALLKGRDLIRLSQEEMRKVRWDKVSMIFQAAMNALNPVQRVDRQIVEAIRVHDPNLPRQEAEKSTHKLLELVKIPKDRFKDYPHQFSGGMKQRAIIAMALACSPSLIIADEPTTALDVIVQKQILTAIKHFQKQMNIGMIFISHDLAVVAQVCKWIGVMHQGVLVEYGTRENVLDCPAHPYTKTLVSALLTLSEKAVDLKHRDCPTVNSIDTVSRPSGCAFCEKCPDADDNCAGDEIGWVSLANDHKVRCSRIKGDP